MDELISKRGTVDAITRWVSDKDDGRTLLDVIKQMPSETQQETISKDYAKAVRNWLVHYQVKCVELQGRYTPYEVLGWVVSDWRRENEIW